MFDYRRAKQLLRPYYTFKFKSPRKGKDFTPQQKRIIRLRYNKLADVFKKREQFSFIKNKKVKDGIRTNTGTFLHYPNAKQKKKIVAKGIRFKIAPIEIKFGKRRELYFEFPTAMQNDIDLIEKFVLFLRKKYRPDYVRWAFKNQKFSEVMTPGKHQLYASVVVPTKFEEKKAGLGWENGRYIGVYIGWAPNFER